MIENVLKYFPAELQRQILNTKVNDNLKEIRIRAYQKVCLEYYNLEVFLEYVSTTTDILNILVNISKNSIYAIQNDINNGFVVVPGGHRIGICGEAVISNGKIINVKNINSMNIRISTQVFGAANKILPYVIKNSKTIRNTLIVSPPGCGKTTILRDLIRQLSNGVENLNFKGKNIGVVDERGEIASVYFGKSGLDLGKRTDVMSNCSKSTGIDMLVRSMGLDIIATDEIGQKEDIEAILRASLSGVGMIFTMHASSVEDVYQNKNVSCLLNNGIFECIVVLSNKNGAGTIENIKLVKNLGKEGECDCI